jgi:hypothetical protein
MSIVPVLLTDQARAELTGGDAAEPRGSEPLHKSCRRCGPTLHAPGFTHDGPTGGGSVRRTDRRRAAHDGAAHRGPMRLPRRLDRHAGSSPGRGRLKSAVVPRTGVPTARDAGRPEPTEDLPPP